MPAVQPFFNPALFTEYRSSSLVNAEYRKKGDKRGSQSQVTQMTMRR